MDGPLVTIGVPVFRGHDDLPTTLECLRTQTYASLDVVISVDGPGGGGAVAESRHLLFRDGRVRERAPARAPQIHPWRCRLASADPYRAARDEHVPRADPRCVARCRRRTAGRRVRKLWKPPPLPDRACPHRRVPVRRRADLLYQRPSVLTRWQFPSRC